ncbi:MAG: nitroreductase family deazaflavin-dependent oxidoreductase [Gammaproteobacteria bacterium]|nr:nitroreductase family deazaflavin-dependent oxidoreductase [Gammaproteobacteria bacterium]
MPSKLALRFLGFQNFLLRNDWLGGMGEVILVLTTTGRRSGKPVSTPIGYVRDGDVWAALSYPTSNWYRNLRQTPEALLEMRGKPVRVRAEFVDDEPGRQRLVDLYRQQRAKNFKMFFNVAMDAPAEDVARGIAARAFVRFLPLESTRP